MSENGGGVEPSSWPRQFDASWQKYRESWPADEPPPAPKNVEQVIRLHAGLALAPGLPPELKPLVEQAMSVRVTQAAQPPCSQLANALKECASPIEAALVCALIVASGDHHTLIVRSKGMDRKTEGYHGSSRLTIEPQAQLGQHRVDVLITGSVDVYGREDPDARLTVVGTSECRMVIECDGHEYHNLSREQARADRERDRALQALGFEVFRYTGSELWADVFVAADEALTAVMMKAREGAAR